MKVIWLAHVKAVEYVCHPVHKLWGGVLHLSEHPAGVSHQGPGQPGRDLTHVGDHGSPLHLILSPHVGQGIDQLVKGVIGAAEGEGEEKDGDKTRA